MTTEAFSRNVGKLFSELKLVTDNLLFDNDLAHWQFQSSQVTWAGDTCGAACSSIFMVVETGDFLTDVLWLLH